MEAFIIALVMVIGVSFIFDDFCTTLGDVLYGLIPSMPNETALYIGIIGATVMPHNLFFWCKPENLIEPKLSRL
jgi:manganese transport protein